MNRATTISEDVQIAFIEAMRVGFAGGGKTSPVRGLPGAKKIEHIHNKITIVDCWYKPKNSRYSAGHTTALIAGIPVWTMNYWGCYSKFVTPFLKMALAHQYFKDFDPCAPFMGCRGPAAYEDIEDYPGCIYTNTVNEGGTFKRFSGRDSIANRNGHPRGWHEYNGLWLRED